MTAQTFPYDNVGISFEANQVINRAAVQHAGASEPRDRRGLGIAGHLLYSDHSHLGRASPQRRSSS
jgi:hypothetical protein